MSPIIGPRGVAALYKRSVHLTSQTHPWLAGTHEGITTATDVASLTSLFARQTSAEAAAAMLMLQTFCGLLSTLIGPSLTERLLRPVWATFLSGSSAPNTPP